MSETRSTCRCCGLGRRAIIEPHGDDVTGVRGKPNHPANFGRSCTKAATLHLSARRDARAFDPELRRNPSARRAGASWHEAPDHADVFFVADSNAGARAVRS